MVGETTHGTGTSVTSFIVVVPSPPRGITPVPTSVTPGSAGSSAPLGFRTASRKPTAVAIRTSGIHFILRHTFRMVGDYAASGTPRALASACDNRASIVRSA